MTYSPGKTGPSLQAVLFDMDGTLVDTEPYWIAAEYRLVEQYGGTWNDEHAHALIGNALLTSAEYMREVAGVPLDPPVIVERLLDDVVAAAERKMPWQPGARELISELRAAGIACAMVTMSYTRLADTLVTQLPPGSFGAVVTGDQVDEGKPHPEAYLTAAARLNVEPVCCVAIEDSRTGVDSAAAAGCAVVAVPHHVPIEPSPDLTIVRSLAELDLDTLRALIAGERVR